jgi:hypothetical protein
MAEVLEETIKALGLKLRPAVPKDQASQEGWLLEITTARFHMRSPVTPEAVQAITVRIKVDLANSLRTQCGEAPGKFTQMTEITVTKEGPHVWGHIYLK